MLEFLPAVIYVKNTEFNFFFYSFLQKCADNDMTGLI